MFIVYVLSENSAFSHCGTYIFSMGRGQSRLSIQQNSVTRGQKEYANAADQSENPDQADINSLLASSFSKGLDCSFDEQIISMFYARIGPDTTPEDIVAIRKMIDIFHDQKMTKQQLQNIQVNTKLEAATRIKERMSAETPGSAEYIRLSDKLDNIDTLVHEGLKKSNPQYARFF